MIICNKCELRVENTKGVECEQPRMKFGLKYKEIESTLSEGMPLAERVEYKKFNFSTFNPILPKAFLWKGLQKSS